MNEYVFLILVVSYFAGAAATKEVLYTLYSPKGKWCNRIEYISKTNATMFCPILNIIFPIIMIIKGIYTNK